MAIVIKFTANLKQILLAIPEPITRHVAFPVALGVYRADQLRHRRSFTEYILYFAPFQSVALLRADWALIPFARRHRGRSTQETHFSQVQALAHLPHKRLSFLDLHFIKESFGRGVSKTGFLTTIYVFIKVAWSHNLDFSGNVSKTSSSCWWF